MEKKCYWVNYVINKDLCRSESLNPINTYNFYIATNVNVHQHPETLYNNKKAEIENPS